MTTDNIVLLVHTQQEKYLFDFLVSKFFMMLFYPSFWFYIYVLLESP